MYTRQDLANMLDTRQDVKVYQKTANVLWRPTVPGETVITAISGVIETIRTVGMGQIIIRNFDVGKTTELYVVGLNKFASRYKVEEGMHYIIDGINWGLAKAEGRIRSFQWDAEAFTFDAPWGEQMLCNPGDWIAIPYPTKDDLDIYRIEKNAFANTYSVVDNIAVIM